MPNRIMMAPMTRNRADDQGVLSPLASIYYSQRASAGMIVSESVNISPLGQGYLLTPGIYTTSQMAAWGNVSSAIERANKDCQWWLQLTHCGRATHITNRSTSLQPLAPSAIRAAATIYTTAGRVPMDEPREMTQTDIDGVLEEYYQAARNSIKCGAHGVELHCGAGCLPHQFLASSSNKRMDKYGGSPQRRARFIIELVDAVSSAIGAAHVGVRVTPLNAFNDAVEQDVYEMYTYLMQELGKKHVAFVHAQRIAGKKLPDGSRPQGLLSMAEAPHTLTDAALSGHPLHMQSEMLLAAMRRAFPNTFVISGGYNRQTAMDAIRPQGDVSIASNSSHQTETHDAKHQSPAFSTPSSSLHVSTSDPMYADVMRHVQEIKEQELAQDPLAALMAQLGDPTQTHSKKNDSDAVMEAAMQSAYPSEPHRSTLGEFGGSLESFADVVGFGWSFISTPDLVERLRYDLPLNKDCRAGLYVGAREGVDLALGYCDYPSFEEVLASTTCNYSLHAVLSDREKLRQVVQASQALPHPLMDADVTIGQTC